MRRAGWLLMALLSSGCEQIVGMQDPLPLLADAGFDATLPVADASDAAPPIDAADASRVEDAGSSPEEHVPCEGAGCVCTKAPAAGAEGEPFLDVPPAALEADAVKQLHAAGVIGPCETSPMLFCPSCQLSRSAIVKWLVVAAKLPLVAPDSPTFPDVPKNHPFYAHVETAFAQKIASGFSDGKFRPNAPLSRASAAVMIQRAAQIPIPDPLPNSFADVPATFWAHEAIEALYSACATTGCSSDAGGKLFCPDNLVSRRGGAVIIARAFGFIAPACASEPPDS